LANYGTAGQATEHNKIWRMRITCWIIKAKNTHSEYVILIAFPQRKLLHEGSSMLIYKYLACLIKYLANNQPRILFQWSGMKEQSNATMYNIC